MSNHKSHDDEPDTPGKAFAREHGLPYIQFSRRYAQTRAEGAMDVYWGIKSIDDILRIVKEGCLFSDPTIAATLIPSQKPKP